MRSGRQSGKARALISRAEKVKLRELIERTERETSGEICVMLLDDVENPREFAVQYFNHLGIGKKDLDNGVLILVVLGRRRIELVVGRAIERRIPQAVLDSIVHDTLIPHFRDGRFGHGLLQAIDALGRIFREDLPKGHLAQDHPLPGVVDLGPGAPT